MIDLLKNGAKSMLEKKNLFVLLQIMWLIEFHFLAILSAKNLICWTFNIQIYEPSIIQKYSQEIVNWIDTYKEYIEIMGIVLLLVGFSGSFLKFIPLFNTYTIINLYSDFGLYAGCWFLLMFFTYKIYMSLGRAFLIAPIIAYLLFLVLKQVKEWFKSKGITFG